MKKKTPVPGFRALAVTAIGLFALGAVSLYFGLSRESAPEVSAPALRPDEKAAIIHVNEGSGWLSTGEDFQIGEWYSGAVHESDYFANFRGSDGGATVDLRLSGLGRTGTFACAESRQATVELRVDVDNAYRSGAAGDCRVTVTRFDGEVMEGHYRATLAHSGDAADKLTISGNFRATRPQPEKLSAVSAASPVSPTSQAAPGIAGL